MSKVYDKVIDWFPDLLKYMPTDNEDGGYPPRKYFWDVFATLEPDVVKSILTKSHEGRAINEESKENDMIVVRSDLLNELENTSYVSSKSHHNREEG